MLQQAIDLREEGDALHAFLAGLEDADWARPTPFKGWTANAVMQHLHFGDWMASVSLEDPDRFARIVEARRAARARGDPAPDAVEGAPDMGEGRALLDGWWACLSRLCDLMEGEDPDRRVAWVGPAMGLRSFATARQMETWAHGQDIYDLLQAPREHFDRLANICVLGCRTFAGPSAIAAWSRRRPCLMCGSRSPPAALTGWKGRRRFLPPDAGPQYRRRSGGRGRAGAGLDGCDASPARPTTRPLPVPGNACIGTQGAGAGRTA